MFARSTTGCSGVEGADACGGVLERARLRSEGADDRGGDLATSHLRSSWEDALRLSVGSGFLGERDLSGCRRDGTLSFERESLVL